MGEQRNQDGRYAAEHTDDEILAAVRAHEPAATSEVADEIGMTRQGADRRLRQLRDHGRVNSKKIAASLVWFAPKAPERRERAETPHESNGVDTTTKDDERQEPRPARRDADASREGASERARDAVDTDELPATVDPDDAAAAIAAARDYVRDHGGATKQDLVTAIMPDHPLGYDPDAALEKIDGDDRYRGAWWRRVVKPGFEALDDVEKPPRGASTWGHTGGRDP